MPIRYIVPALVMLLLSGCATLQGQFKEPQIAVQNLQLRSVSLAEMKVDFILGVDNPNPIAMAVNGLSYRLEFDERPLFEGRTEERVKVAANGSSRISLPFTLAYEDLLGGLEALGTGKSLRYTLSGKIDMGLFSVPYSHSGELRLPSLPMVRVSRLRVARFGLDGVTLQLGLTVSNGNAFPLRLAGLSGDVKLAGTSLVQWQSLSELLVGAGQQDEVDLSLKLGYRQLGGLADRLARDTMLPLTLDGAISVPVGKEERQIPLHWSGEVPISR